MLTRRLHRAVTNRLDRRYVRRAELGKVKRRTETLSGRVRAAGASGRRLQVEVRRLTALYEQLKKSQRDTQAEIVVLRRLVAENSRLAKESSLAIEGLLEQEMLLRQKLDAVDGIGR